MDVGFLRIVVPGLEWSSYETAPGMHGSAPAGLPVGRPIGLHMRCIVHPMGRPVGFSTFRWKDQWKVNGKAHGIRQQVP